METTQGAQIKEIREMAKRETRHMLWWKLVVLFTIAATAAVVLTGTYILLKDDQESTKRA
jgi:Na+-transporting NADH:ubiquinone oxidoreductase subunit NqrC